MGHRVFDTCLTIADNRVCFAAILKLQCIEEPAGTAERDEFDLFHAFASFHRLAGIVELHFADPFHRSDITQVYVFAECELVFHAHQPSFEHCGHIRLCLAGCLSYPFGGMIFVDLVGRDYFHKFLSLPVLVIKVELADFVTDCHSCKF